MSTPVTSSQGPFTDPLEEISKIGKSRSTKAGISSVSGDMFGDIDSLNGLNKSTLTSAKETNNRRKGQSPLEEGSSMGSARSSVSREPAEESSFGYSESQSRKMPFDDLKESHQTVFDMPNVPRNSRRSFDQTPSSASYTETSSQVDTSPKSEENVQHANDIWLTVSEIPLFTPVTRAPPPSRPPPPIPRRASKSGKGSFASNTRRFGRMPNNSDDNSDAQSGEEMDSNSAAATKKEALDRAEARFKHAKGATKREHAHASRNREPVQVERDEQAIDEEIVRERLDHERHEREREEEVREQRRLEKERMKEIERVKARQAVERATREARERAASEARLKSERAAVQRAQAEARERAAVDARERAERAAGEARERASAEAKERAAAESREKAAQEKAAVARAEAEARRRAERAAVERITAEARERAAAEARERAAAAAAAKANQQKNDNDLESFFSMGSRPSSVPRSRATSSDSATDPLSQNRQGPEGAQRASSTGVPSNVRKSSSTTNFVDDLSSIFGAAPSAGEFQDVEGETEERRRARLERQQRTQERAAKALAEKNQRDLQSQKEQEERQRIAATLDIEIKRWAAGKEGNLRAMLSTLQYVLWPECGWQPVSLTDLITGASVKKAYRKATLCIHPDKVQQKGANIQQKYVAEKVFDLLKEAWNKFNSEELF